MFFIWKICNCAILFRFLELVPKRDVTALYFYNLVPFTILIIFALTKVWVYQSKLIVNFAWLLFSIKKHCIILAFVLYILQEVEIYRYQWVSQQGRFYGVGDLPKSLHAAYRECQRPINEKVSHQLICKNGNFDCFLYLDESSII